MKIFNFIKTKDFLGESINFSILNQPYFQTIAGGLISILIYFLYLFFFYYFGEDFLFMKNPNTFSLIKARNEESIKNLNLS